MSTQTEGLRFIFLVLAIFVTIICFYMSAFNMKLLHSYLHGPWTVTNITALQKMSDLDENTRYIAGIHNITKDLGNLMFVYASLKAIGLRHDAYLIVPETSSLRKAFSNLDAVFVSGQLYSRLLKKYWEDRHEFNVCCKFYKSEVEKLFANRNFELISGYMQSYRYFHPFLAKTIRSEFTFFPEIVSQAEAHLRKAKHWRILGSANQTNATGSQQLHRILATNTNYTFVGIHIRHDYFVTDWGPNVKRGFRIASIIYFANAMNYFRKKFKNVIFVVISDNLRWVRRVLIARAKGELYFLRSGFREIDMAALTRCNHTIMSTGTFSWWIAYLTGGTTIYYKKWPRPGSSLDKDVVKEDFFLKQWIPME